SREAAGLVLLDRDEVIGSAAGPGERRLLQRRRKDRLPAQRLTEGRVKTQQQQQVRQDVHGKTDTQTDKERQTQSQTNAETLFTSRCCGRGVCHGQRLQQVPLPSEAGFPLHWQVQCAPGAPSPSGRTRPRLRYFSTEAASNRAAGSGRIVPPPPPP
ncbi:unnamed protein product, partial [Prorocentrum cordatum]